MVSSATPSVRADDNSAAVLDRVEYFVDRATGAISGIAVIGLLIGAIVVVVDVMLRWLFASGVTALNEVMGQVFAMAVAATLPAGVARRVHVKVDLLAGHFGPRTLYYLTITGSLALAVFFAVLAWFTWQLGLRFLAQTRETLILQWPLAPTYLFAAVAFALSFLTQLVKLWRDIVTTPVSSAIRTSVAGFIATGLFAGLIVTGALWSLVDWVSLQDAVMSRPGLFVVIAFTLLWLAVLCQIPLAPITAIIGLVGTALVLSLPATGRVFATDAMDFLTNWQIATLPLFLMMGSFAVAAGISTDIYTLANALLGRVKGGLLYATVAGCAGFGAVSGTSIATAATFGSIALPEMKRHRYHQGLASGAVAAGGTLGSLVPPSGSIILFALLTEQSIGILFVAAMLPALLALVLYFITIWIQLRIHPQRAPLVDSISQPLAPAIWRAMPVITLFALVIGGLYGGVFTATESAAFGAVGAFTLALVRGKLSRERLLEVLSETTATTALIYALIFGALIFSFYINLGQAAEFVVQWITALDLTPVIVLIVLLVFYLVLGAVMDSFAVMVITVPVVTPLVTGLGFDILHWGILMLVVVEIGLISPPFGINLFVLKTLQPDQPIGRIMRGVLPFLLADSVKVILLVLFPAIALWLPSTMN